MSAIPLAWATTQPPRAAGFALNDAALAPTLDALIEDDSESHLLFVSPTGGGKGRCCIIPTLLRTADPCIVVDIKGEATRATARYRRETLGHRVVVIDPYGIATDRSDAINPLDYLCGNPAEVGDNATTLSEVLTGEEMGTKEPFWDHLGNDFAAGLMAYAATCGDPSKRSLTWISNFITSDDAVYTLACLLDKEPDMNDFAKRQLVSFLNHEADKVRTSVRSTAQQHLRLFASPMVQQSVARTTFDLDDIRHGAPTDVFLVLPPARLKSHGSLLRMWLTVLLGCISERQSKPANRTLLIVDELAQLGPIPMVLQALTLLRGYGLRAMILLQSLNQLSSMWPRDHQTIIDNCGIIGAFGQTRPSMVNPLVDVLGDVSTAALMRMPADQMALSCIGQPTRFVRKLDYLKDEMFQGRYDQNPFYASKVTR